jgi:hypothetical protein
MRTPEPPITSRCDQRGRSAGRARAGSGDSAAATHRRPDVYPDPLPFRPERFLGRRTDPYAWLPFGGGTRRCLGAAFALSEMRVVLRTVLTSTRLRAARPGLEPVQRRIVTLAPRHGTRVRLEQNPPHVPARAAHDGHGGELCEAAGTPGGA